MTNTSAVDDSIAARLLAMPEAAQETLRALGVLTPAGINTLLDEAGRLVVVEPDTAARLLAIIEAVAAPAHAESALAASWYLRARLLLEAGQASESLVLITAARGKYEQLGLGVEALRTELGRMHVLDDLGRHGDAADVGRQVLAGVEQLPHDERSQHLQASALSNLGVSLGFTGQHEEALRAYARAEAIWRTLDDPDTAAATRANQGIELIAMGRAVAGVRCLDAAIATFSACGDRFWCAKCTAHRAEAMAALGRYSDALDDLRMARQTFQDLHAQTEECRVAIDTAAVLLALGLAEEAATVLDDIVPGLRQAGIRHDLAAALQVHGTALAHTGRRTRATAELSEAMALYADVDDRPNQARAAVELSRCLPPAQALATAAQAAAMVNERRWPGIACLAILRLAELQRDDLPATEVLLDRAARLAAGHQLIHLSQVVDLQRGILRAHRHDTDAAIGYLTRSLTDAEQIRIGIRDDGLRAAYTSSYAQAVDHLVRALLDRGDPEDITRAAQLSDRSKAGTLADVLRGLVGRSTSTLWTEPRSTRLLRELQAAYSTLFSTPDASQALHARIEALERRIAAAEAMADPAPPPAPHPSSPLPLETTIVAYHVLGDEVVAFITVAGRLSVRRRITTYQHVVRLLDDLEGHLGSHTLTVLADHAAARASACRRVLQKLYLAVFAPLVDLLPGPTDSPGSLVIVPHGPLHAVPFQALHDGRHYVLADWVITLSPSIEVAASAHARPARTGPAVVIGVADDRTPFVEEEARRIGALLGDCHTFTAADGTLQRLRDHAPDAGTIHLACHGLFRPGNPAFTSLRLTDRWVRAADVADLALDGSLLVLSACETGRVAHPVGDGAAALACAFLASGARSVIVSRWLADDRWTSELMVDLHRHLRRGAAPATALRAAQLAASAKHLHPFYWAPFTTIGAP